MSKLSRMFTHEHTHTPTTTINNYSIIIEITTQNVQNAFNQELNEISFLNANIG